MATITIPFKPRKWQNQIIGQLKRNNVLVVHRGAGKTKLTANIVNKAAIIGPPDADYAFILPQANQAQRVVWKPLVECASVIPDIEFNKSTMVVKYPNGSRIFVLGADNPDSLRGMHLHGVILDEFSEMHPDTWTAVRPMLSNHSGWVIWIGTPKGNQNEFYHKYMQSQQPEFIEAGWFGTILRWQDTGALKDEEIQLAKMDMPSTTFQQEYECSFTSALLGAYWADEIDKLWGSQRISRLPLFRPDLKVHTGWDLGIADEMAVWFYQQVKDEIHVIDFEEHSGYGFPEWKEILDYRHDKDGYNYGTHWAPHDIQVRELSTGISRIESALKLGIKMTKVPPTKPMDRIQLVRQQLHTCKFDIARCDVGVDHLRNYKAKLDKLGNDLGPEHDKHSHASDAFGYMWAGIDSLKRKPASFGHMPIIGR